MAVTADARSTASADGARLGPLLLALSPGVAFVVASATRYTEPMFSNPPALLGLPLGVALLFVAAGLTVLAVVAASRAWHSGGGVRSTTAFAVPALALVALGPAFIAWLVALG